jgi:diketogulonate reductase-like aldo/keto reductase
MIFKKLGNTSAEVPVIGQGTTGAGSHLTTTIEGIGKRIAVLRAGIELGMTFLDTAESYENGHAEEVVGKAIKGIRDKAFVSSKFKPGNNSFKGVMNAIEGSLRRLGTDYIDLYQIQWPNPAIAVSETMRAMARLLEQGKIRFAGVSNFSPDEFKEAQSFLGSNKIVSCQAEYNLRNRSVESDFLGFSEEHRITVIAYSPFNQGNLVLNKDERQFLNALSKKYERSIFQIILNWIILHPTVIAIPKSMCFKHSKENAEASEFNLNEEDIDEINKVFRQEPLLVPTSRIRVINYDVDDTHPIYTTLEEALENKLDIQPSPVCLAQEIKGGKFLKPIELVPSEDDSGSYEYDLLHGRVRYWAWVIAHDGKVPIPAYVLEQKPTSRT